MTKQTLLIVEDDPGLQNQLKWSLENYNVVLATDRASAVDAVSKHKPAVMLQDLGLPPDAEGVDEGFQCIRDIKHVSPQTKIIVMTGNSDFTNAVHAVALGAHDFYQKPVDVQTLEMIIGRAYHLHDIEQQGKKQISPEVLGLITQDKEMLKICRLIKRIAPVDVTCTLLGESGTGKEVLATALHSSSDRSEHNFVAINCAAVPESLMESELFGYEKGAFTGAAKTTIGKIEHAHKGTLFLDEIGDMPLHLQAKLLRFLQEKTIQRVGGRDTIPVDVRVVCATNKDLAKMSEEGTFREDLYYRIFETVINIPPLRDRTGDKIMLARHFVAKYAKEYNPKVTGIAPDAENSIECYDWPGNIRQLENMLKQAVVLCDSAVIREADLNLPSADVEQTNMRLKDIRRDVEIKAIQQAMAMSDNNYSSAAKLLGVSRPTLYDLIKKYELL